MNQRECELSNQITHLMEIKMMETERAVFFHLLFIKNTKMKGMQYL